ncbi:MAG: PilZ domain-containing protein [Armatimonadota bacterium]
MDKQDLNTIDTEEFSTSKGHNSGASVIIQELKNIPDFKDSFMLPTPYNFNFQATNKEASYSGCGTIFSFLNDGGGIYAVFKKQLEINTILLLNILINKLQLNIIGYIASIKQTKLKDIYLAHVIFKNLSSEDRNKILRFINPPEKDAGDKRQYIRLHKTIPVIYQVFKQDKTLSENTAVVYTVDISRGGVKIASEENLSVNELLYIQLKNGNKTVYCTGKVIWAEFSEQHNKYFCGIKFINLTKQISNDLIEIVSDF